MDAHAVARECGAADEFAILAKRRAAVKERRNAILM
jgi:hypothetical protein